MRTKRANFLKYQHKKKKPPRGRRLHMILMKKQQFMYNMFMHIKRHFKIHLFIYLITSLEEFLRNYLSLSSGTEDLLFAC